MKLRTLIIDDEPIALQKLQKYTTQVPFLELAAACSNGFEALEFLAGNNVDLIVTDINMPDLNGLDFVRSLASAPMVIFTTAHAQYAVDSYRVSAVDYLLKPYGYAEFHRAAAKAFDLFGNRNRTCEATPESLFVKTDYRYVRVSLRDILYIKGYGEYLQIFVDGNATPLLTLSSFASIKQRLADNFLQVHRSYIVNIDHALQIERNRIVMPGDTFIPVGDSYKADFQQYLASHAIGKSPRS